LLSTNFYPSQRLKNQQEFDESIKERLAEIHGFMSAIEGDRAGSSNSLLQYPTIQSTIKKLLQHAQEVVSYVIKYGKAGGKGQGCYNLPTRPYTHKLIFVPHQITPAAILDLINIPDAVAQSNRFKRRFDTIQHEFNTAIVVQNNKAVSKRSNKDDLEAARAYLSPLEFPEEGIKYREHTLDTGGWFFASQEFRDWRDGIAQTVQVTDVRSACRVLWCPGGRK
jgi:hypothetical protein